MKFVSTRVLALLGRGGIVRARAHGQREEESNELHECLVVLFIARGASFAPGDTWL
jgi:hypothetical protein